MVTYLVAGYSSFIKDFLRIIDACRLLQTRSSCYNVTFQTCAEVCVQVPVLFRRSSKHVLLAIVTPFA